LSWGRQGFLKTASAQLTAKYFEWKSAPLLRSPNREPTIEALDLSWRAGGTAYGRVFFVIGRVFSERTVQLPAEIGAQNPELVLGLVPLGAIAAPP